MHYLDTRRAEFIAFCKRMFAHRMFLAPAPDCDEGFFATDENDVTVFVLARYRQTTSAPPSVRDAVATVQYAHRFAKGHSVVIATNAPEDPNVAKLLRREYNAVVLDKNLLTDMAANEGLDRMAELERFTRKQW